MTLGNFLPLYQPELPATEVTGWDLNPRPAVPVDNPKSSVRRFLSVSFVSVSTTSQTTCQQLSFRL